MARRSGVLELAVLGLLHEAPMHGYELRKRLNSAFGWGRALSYGSLYPCLKTMLAEGWISDDAPAAGTPPLRRAKIVYRLSPEGRRRFAELLDEGGPSAWEDDNFGVHFAFFARTDAAVRLRILEGRRRRLEERLDRVRTQLQRTQERLDAYALELQRHGLESVEREVDWLSGLIASERHGDVKPPAGGGKRTTKGARRTLAGPGEEPRATSRSKFRKPNPT
ncbi:PadR family transcriptional regulator [Actinopolymorpha alba]|uniref:PadR family transcriptional regulator n=1 Tax=Actinopolymorpha alba TaxID=533267 RepID=UPI0003672523|nr:PadR family transcriptional regulator [Actinopolymorpha alba]